MCRIATSLLAAVDDDSVMFVIPFSHWSILYSFTHPIFLNLSVSILYERITSWPISTWHPTNRPIGSSPINDNWQCRNQKLKLKDYHQNFTILSLIKSNHYWSHLYPTILFIGIYTCEEGQNASVLIGSICIYVMSTYVTNSKYIPINKRINSFTVLTFNVKLSACKSFYVSQFDIYTYFIGLFNQCGVYCIVRLNNLGINMARFNCLMFNFV